MKQVLITGGKISGIVAAVPLFLSQVPAPWDTVVCAIIIVCGAVTAVIPAPEEQSAWLPTYKVVSVIGLNFGWAANHLTMLHGGAAQSDESQKK